MSSKEKIGVAALLATAVVICAVFMLFDSNFAVLNPKGVIAQKERALMIYAVLLSTIVVIPVFIMTFFIAYKYRESNTKAKYTPDWDHNLALESVWWGIPSLIILVLSVLTWQSTHELDPFKPLNSSVKPVTVQAVALDWKWLFIYPEHKIATVNYLQIPVDTPINFQITADAPMNSLWIPQLAGQMYAMSGMSTGLHVMANELGEYRGSSANISGAGFAGMHFKVQATTTDDFAAWVHQQSVLDNQLTWDSYNKLAQPSRNNPPSYYALGDRNLYNNILMKYTGPRSQEDSSMYEGPSVDLPAHYMEEL